VLLKKFRLGIKTRDAILGNRKYWIRRYGTFAVHLRKCIISEIAQITHKRRKTNEIEDSIRTLNGTRI